MRLFSCDPTTIFGARIRGRFLLQALRAGKAQADLAYFSPTDRGPIVAFPDDKMPWQVVIYQALVKTIG